MGEEGGNHREHRLHQSKKESMESPGITLIGQRRSWDQTVGTWFKAFWHENTLRFLAVSSAIVVWWAASSMMPEHYAVFLPGPQRVFAAIVEAFQTEGLGEALLGALLPMLTGYFLAIAMGIPLDRKSVV